MISQTKQQFNDKGDPSHIKSVLDADRKADLRAHHFAYGSHQEAQKRGVGESATMKQPEVQKPMVPRKGKDAIFGGSPGKAKGDFKTSNQTFVKWITPQPQFGMA